MSSSTEPHVLYDTSDIDYLPPEVRSDIREGIRTCFLKAWQKYNSATGLDKAKHYDKIAEQSTKLLKLVRNTTKPKVERLRKSSDECWQAYVDIGIKYFVNIPSTVFDHDDVGQDELINVYELSAGGLLNKFDWLRLLILTIERALEKGDLRTVRARLQELEEAVVKMGINLEDIEHYYEDVLAAANALLMAGDISEPDSRGDERVAAFQSWAEMVGAVAHRR